MRDYRVSIYYRKRGDKKGILYLEIKCEEMPIIKVTIIQHHLQVSL